MSVAAAREAGLLDRDDADDRTRLAAADATGMEAGKVSTYYTRRTGRRKRAFPKFWAVVAAASHVCLSVATGTGPCADDRPFRRLAADAHAREPFAALAADCGFDGEPHHRFLERRLGVIGIIPPERGRPRTRSAADVRGGFHRNFLHHHWPRRLYGQRWQVEAFFSMLKRLLDSFLRATNWRSQHREMSLKVLTLNFMIIAGAK